MFLFCTLYLDQPEARASAFINDILGINPHKHMNAYCPDTLEIDLEKCAEDAITKAVADHVTLHGREHDLLNGFSSGLGSIGTAHR
jgi:hypothetical protein